jgi:non-specific serine/threonine protein kinase
MVFSVEAFASIAFKERRSSQAATFWGAAAILREKINSPMPTYEHNKYERNVAEARLALGEEAFSAAWERGRAMTMDEAVALAIGEI